VNSALTSGHASALQRSCSIVRRMRLMRSHGCQRRASVSCFVHFVSVTFPRCSSIPTIARRSFLSSGLLSDVKIHTQRGASV